MVEKYQTTKMISLDSDGVANTKVNYQFTSKFYIN